MIVGAGTKGRGRLRGRGAAYCGGAEVSYLLADISVREGCRLGGDRGRTAGRRDVLCANAGIFPDKRLADMTDEDLDTVLGTNLRGCILSVQACLPALQQSAHGRVILTSSITGPITGFPGWSHYGASKAGQLGFMRAPPPSSWRRTPSRSTRCCPAT